MIWLLALRWHERSDPFPEVEPPADQLRALGDSEDFVTQNAFTSLAPIRPGRFWQLTSRLTELVGNYTARHVFTTGNLSGLTTVHFARFMRVGPEQHVLFTSYYDGSLESYNNDFVDQVAWVLNTVFGQQAGYPRTRWMVRDGAHNERWFKNFIRGHQVPTQVWFSAYPDLAAVTIDQNARLRKGLSGELDGEELHGMAATAVNSGSRRATSRAWSCRATASCAPRRTSSWRSPTAEAARAWLRGVAPRDLLRRGAARDGRAQPRAHRGRPGPAGPAVRDVARVLAGVPRGHDQRPPEPAARRRGAGGSGALDLGRTGRPRGPRPAPRLRPGRGRSRRSRSTRLRSGLADGGLREVACLDTTDIGRGEHFGFRDGLSQPAYVRGRVRPGPPMHTVAPGEFLLGYPNEHGQYSRSPLVPAVDDPDGLLPRRTRGTDASTAPVTPDLEDAHDFGRNGSYLVLRTLDQDVGGFWRFVDAATRTPDGAPDAAARTALAARMVGRWPSGAPLTRTPETGPARARRGQRLRLPGDGPPRSRLSARRARTSHQPARLAASEARDAGLGRRREASSTPPPGSGLRSRRSSPEAALEEDPDEPGRRGLHFVALCADIARQFEFISHTWVMNPSFAGLLDDADPLLGGHSARGTSFTVQGAPVRRRVTDVPAFVTVRGGAYFFLPGARALGYLAQR